MSALASEHCEACEKGTPPLERGRGGDARRRRPGLGARGQPEARAASSRSTNFRDAFGFVARAALVAEAEFHHPDIELGWGRAAFELTTHAASGLTRNDFVMAAKLDQLARGAEAAREPRSRDARPHQGGRRAPQRDLPDAGAGDPAEHAATTSCSAGTSCSACRSSRATTSRPSASGSTAPARAYGIEEEIAEAVGEPLPVRTAPETPGPSSQLEPPSRRSTPSGSRPSLLELVEVRLERQRGGRAQRRRERRPRPRRAARRVSRTPRSSASTSRRSRSSAVLDVLVELRARVPHDRPVTGAQRRQVERRAAARSDSR